MSNNSLEQDFKDSDWIPVGTVSQTHGLTGALYVTFREDPQDWQDQISSLALGKAPVSGNPENLKCWDLGAFRFQAHRKGWLLWLEGVTDLTQAMGLKGQELWILKSDLSSLSGQEAFLREFLGFEVFNGHERLGSITGFVSAAGRDFFRLEMEDSCEVEVPWVPQWFDEYSFSDRRLRIHFPPGLMEVLKDS